MFCNNSNSSFRSTDSWVCVMAGIKRTTADKYFSFCVRERANYTCEYCGKVEPERKGLECCHIYGRRAKSVRHDPDNAVCLCHTHHRYFTENPIEFQIWLKKHLGDGRLEILREKYNQIIKYTKALEKEIAAHYKKQHEAMLQKRNEGHLGPMEFEGYL